MSQIFIMDRRSFYDVTNLIPKFIKDCAKKGKPMSEANAVLAFMIEMKCNRVIKVPFDLSEHEKAGAILGKIRNWDWNICKEIAEERGRK